MKPLAKILVLIVSISAAGAVIWNANRYKKVDEPEKEKTATPESMQGSSKSRMTVHFKEIEQIVEGSDNKKVTRDDIDWILEEQKPNFSKETLMPSSKRIDAILNKDQLEEIIEGKEKSKEAEPNPPIEE